MFNRFTIKFGTKNMSHSQVISYATRITSMLDGNILYPTITPPLIDVVAAITTMQDALTAYGTTPGNRGTSVQKAALDTARAVVEQFLAELAWSCQVITPYDQNAFLSAGWDVRSEPIPVGMLPAVQSLEQVIGETIPSGSVKLRWKRPLAVRPGNVRSYRVMQSLTADINSAVQLAIVTQTFYLDLGAGNRPSNFYWIIPIGSAGEGVVSDVLVAYPQGPVIA